MAKTLLEQAEEARIAGDRDECLRLRKLAEKEEYDALQARHAERVQAAKKEFPINTYIPELNARVTRRLSCLSKRSTGRRRCF